MQFETSRTQVAYFMQRLYRHGLTTTSGGNLSIMDEQGNLWISPSGVDKGSLTRDDIHFEVDYNEVVSSAGSQAVPVMRLSSGTVFSCETYPKVVDCIIADY